MLGAGGIPTISETEPSGTSGIACCDAGITTKPKSSGPTAVPRRANNFLLLIVMSEADWAGRVRAAEAAGVTSVTEDDCFAAFHGDWGQALLLWPTW